MGIWPDGKGLFQVTGLFEELPWDTGCFGFKVARWRGPADPQALAGAMPSFQAAGVRLVYIFTPAGGGGPDAGMAEAGAKPVDRRTVFTRRMDGARASLITVRSFPAEAPSSELLDLALASGTHSRFRMDPEMPTRCFHALYEAWIRRSTLREIADEVLVHGETGQLQGMVTIRQDGSTAHIGLIAVADAARGKGLGSGLVLAAEAWALQKGASDMEVATQGANQQAIALYGRCGYRIKAVEDVYHLWIPPEVS